MRKKAKSEHTGQTIPAAVLAAVIIGAALSTPFYGFGPVLVVTGGLLAAGCVLWMLGGGKRR